MNATLSMLQDFFDRDAADAGLARLYGESAVPFQKVRYRQLLDQAGQLLNGEPFFLASAPGRTELGGNHTDHNNGRVVASAVDLDCIAAIAAGGGRKITVHSADYGRPIAVGLDRLDPVDGEQGTPEALIRGIAAARKKRGEKTGGFTAVVHSTCKPGTGLSSSASFSVLVAGIMATLFDHQTPDPVQLARDGQYAENNFFGKPCGLMDQLSSAVGFTLGIDFKDPENPKITRILTSFAESDYRLVVIDTGGSHINLTPDYAAVPAEIERAVKVLGRDKARGITRQEVLDNIGPIRRQAGDRAVLRLLHFIGEDKRAAAQVTALLHGDFAEFLRLVKESGDSSCRLLQNCSSASSSSEQGILLARELTAGNFPEAVCRVHGGGFAGTVQAYIPKKQFDDYQLFMERAFGEGSVIPIVIGRPGFCICAEHGWVFADN